MNEDSKKVLLYFHGNAEDLFTSTNILESLKYGLDCSVIGLEYPGYGIYEERFNGGPSEEKIKEDAEYVYKFILANMGITEQDIILFGRSMGSGPACWLASQYKPAALCVMSGYMSIQSIVGSYVGPLKYLVQERFDNVN